MVFSDTQEFQLIARGLRFREARLEYADRESQCAQLAHFPDRLEQLPVTEHIGQGQAGATDRFRLTE
jgi:hypothetical protein